MILEPRISGKKADKVIKKLNFAHSHRVEAAGFSGGIWVLWSDTVDIHILKNHFQFIHMEVLYKEKASRFLFTAIYGSPQPCIRKQLWQDLPDQAPLNSTPWLLAGDFNAIIGSEERTGGSDRRARGCHLFQSFISQHGLIDLGSNGPRFTWRRGTLFVRLDRALCNPSWLNLSNSTWVDHLPKVLSDHRPIFVNLGFHTQRYTRDKPFLFLAAWLQHPEFPDIVQDAWSQSDDIVDYIDYFKRKAQCWNRTVFGSIGRRKRRLLARLKGIQERSEAASSSDFLFDLEQSLQMEYEDVCFQEELLWLQKSTSDWICLGDRNTSFYHTKAILRRNRNRISQLKTDDGVWKTDDVELAEMAVNYFKKLYLLDDEAPESYNTRNAFPPIPEAHILLLERDATLEEVKKALFDMKPSKSPGADGLHALFFQSNGILLALVS